MVEMQVATEKEAANFSSLLKEMKNYRVEWFTDSCQQLPDFPCFLYLNLISILESHS